VALQTYRIKTVKATPLHQRANAQLSWCQ